MNWKQIISGMIAGLAIGVGGAFFILQNQVTMLEQQIDLLGSELEAASDIKGIHQAISAQRIKDPLSLYLTGMSISRAYESAGKQPIEHVKEDLEAALVHADFSGAFKDLHPIKDALKTVQESGNDQEISSAIDQASSKLTGQLEKK
ncbi:hypothetical protein QUF80_03480 [Desulfococcaceae bacterium HSG8]|nr:hypothetical protein [Desulfococcaceae bacterium HSG8]